VTNTTKWVSAPIFLAAIAAFFVFCTSGRAQDKPENTLRNPYFDITLSGGGISRLRVDPAGKGKMGSAEFIRDLRPEGWEATPETRTSLSEGAQDAVIGPLRVWQQEPLNAVGRGAAMEPDKLLPGQTLTQTFQITEGGMLDAVSARLPTWNTKTAGATLRLYKGTAVLAERRLTNIVDNDWQELRPPTPQGAGEYRVTLSDPVGEIGWWLLPDAALSGGGQALRNKEVLRGAHALRASVRRTAGTGTLHLRINGPVLTTETSLTTIQGITLSTPHPKNAVPWRWKTTWTKDGYDVSPKAGTVFKRFFTDTMRYMPAEQLKRRANGGLSFENFAWIEAEGTQTADLRLSGSKFHLHWEMTEKEMSLRLDTAQAPDKAGDLLRSGWSLSVLPRRDTVPDAFPRFAFSEGQLTEDANRFWWERAFTYPSPALPAAWFEWMSIIRAWNGGTVTAGEMRQLETYPMTPEGYVHTWRADVGWPLRPKPDTDTRHADTNARFILACWHYWRWTGDDAFLQRQADRLRRAMRYQLTELKGSDGLIVTVSKDIQGRHRDQGNNYWDILPFGHLDAYANTAFYASLQAMSEIETRLGGQPLTDYAALQKKSHQRYDEMFWDAAKGRYIGCVDIDGKRHDYGFTFVNLEALYYGLGDAAKARRIYHWLETEPTSSGKADTYSRFKFAPRATTIHNPVWDEKTPVTDTSTPPWWVSWWKGRPFEEQCQDGGAILYLSYFDLMVRARYFGPENAWKRWNEILARYRLPDRLSGGSPLFTGEVSQQENAGQVGVDYPFPESGLVPCYLLYSIVGLEATPEGLRITPRLPQSMPWAEVQHVVWRGRTLTVRVSPKSVDVTGTNRSGKSFRDHYAIPESGSILLKNDD
jgi:hypothetical protein